MKSGSLYLLEPSGPHRACYGTPLPVLCMDDLQAVYISDLMLYIFSGTVSRTYTDFAINKLHILLYFITQLISVSAIYPGHLQGVTSLVDMYSVYGNLS